MDFGPNALLQGKKTDHESTINRLMHCSIAFALIQTSTTLMPNPIGSSLRRVKEIINSGREFIDHWHR